MAVKLGFDDRNGISTKNCAETSSRSAPANVDGKKVDEAEETPTETKSCAEVVKLAFDDDGNVVSTKNCVETSSRSSPANIDGKKVDEAEETPTETKSGAEVVKLAFDDDGNVVSTKNCTERSSGSSPPATIGGQKGSIKGDEADETPMHEQLPKGSKKEEVALGDNLGKGTEACAKSKTEGVEDLISAMKLEKDKESEMGVNKSQDEEKMDAAQSSAVEMNDIVMLLRSESNEEKGLLVFRSEEEDGSVQFIEIECEIVKQAERSNQLVTYLRPKREREQTEEEKQQASSSVKASIGSAIRRVGRAVKYAKQKQTEFEKAHPMKTKYGKFIFKTAVRFPYSLALDLPTLHDNVTDLYGIMKLPKERRVKKLKAKVPNVVMWVVSCFAGNFLRGEFPSSLAVVETVWDNVMTKGSEETEVEKEKEDKAGKEKETKVEREEETKVRGKEEETKVGGKEEDTKMVKEDDDFCIAVIVEDNECILVDWYEMCPDIEREKHEQDFREYFSTPVQNNEEESEVVSPRHDQEVSANKDNDKGALPPEGTPEDAV